MGAQDRTHRVANFLWVSQLEGGAELGVTGEDQQHQGRWETRAAMTSRKACQCSAHRIYNGRETQVGNVVASHAALGNSFSDVQRLAKAQSIHA